MKNIVIIVLFLIAAAEGFVLLQNKDNIQTGGSVSSGGSLLPKIEYEGKVIAKANGSDITEEEVKERLNFVTSGQADKIDLATLEDKAIEAIAKEVAVQRTVLEEAVASNVHNDPELKKKISSLLSNIYKEKYLESIAYADVSEDKINTLYSELVEKAKNSKQYKVRHILTKSEKEAKSAKDRLAKEKFENVAKEASLDKLSAVNGGDLGFIFLEEYVAEFGDKVKSMKKGEVSAPVKTQFGWHIIKLEDSKKAEILPIEKAKPRIEKQIGTKAVKEYIDGISQNIQIEIVK